MDDNEPDAQTPEACYSTFDVASAIGMDRSTLVRWEGRNLIPKAEFRVFKRPSGGMYRGRLYTKEQFEQIKAYAIANGVGKYAGVATLQHKAGSAHELDEGA